MERFEGAIGARCQPPPQLPLGCGGDIPYAQRGHRGGGTVPAPHREVLIHRAEPLAGEGNAALATAAGCWRRGRRAGTPSFLHAEREE